MSSGEPPPRPLAYRNAEFLGSDAARPLRILAEYLGPMEAFQRERIADTVVFFGSARLAVDGPLGHDCEAARELARRVTAWSALLQEGIAAQSEDRTPAIARSRTSRR